MFDSLAFERIVFPSGFELHYQHRDLPWSAAAVTFVAGTLLDPIGKEGTAHLLEHYMSAGSVGDIPMMSESGLARWLHERKFVFMLGRTSLYSMRFGGKTENGRFAELFGFLTDLCFRPGMDADLEHDREIVRAERTHRIEAREERIRQALLESVFRGHRCVTATGLPDDATLDGISRTDVLAYHGRFIASCNARLVIAGGIVRDVAVRLAERFDRLGARADAEKLQRPMPFRFCPPSPAENRFPPEDGRRAKDVTVACLWHFSEVPFERMVLVRSALERILNRRLRETLRVSYGVKGVSREDPDSQYLGVKTTVAARHERLVRDEIMRSVRDRGAIEREIGLLRDEIAFQIRMDDRTVSSAVSQAIDDLENAGRIHSLCQIAETFERAEAADVIGFVERLIVPENAYTELIED